MSVCFSVQAVLIIRRRDIKQKNMGRRPCCPREINKGAWSREEDEALSRYITIHGEGKWQKVAQNAGT